MPVLFISGNLISRYMTWENDQNMVKDSYARNSCHIVLIYYSKFN